MRSVVKEMVRCNQCFERASRLLDDEVSGVKTASQGHALIFSLRRCEGVLLGASFDKKVEAVVANSPSKISLSHLANKDDTQILELVHNYKFNCLCAEQQLQDRLLKLK
jgi:hypothetical protein